MSIHRFINSVSAADFNVTVVGRQDSRTFGEIVNIFIDLIQLIIPVIFGLALLAFFWGLAKFILRVGGDEKAVAEGKNLMIWGLVALFVMVSVWGIISFVRSDLGWDASLSLPFLPEPGKIN